MGRTLERIGSRPDVARPEVPFQQGTPQELDAMWAQTHPDFRDQMILQMNQEPSSFISSPQDFLQLRRYQSMLNPSSPSNAAGVGGVNSGSIGSGNARNIV